MKIAGKWNGDIHECDSQSLKSRACRLIEKSSGQTNSARAIKKAVLIAAIMESSITKRHIQSIPARRMIQILD